MTDEAALTILLSDGTTVELTADELRQLRRMQEGAK